MGLDDIIISAAGLWGRDIQTIVKDKVIAGSPERCALRSVVRDPHDRLYVIESLHPEDVNHKQRIIDTLNFLSHQGLEEIQPYLPNDMGRSILHHAGRYWQLSPFIHSIPLNRPDYVFDRWRGQVLADFLIQLRATSTAVPGFRPSDSFSIKKFIATLMGTIERREPALLKEIQPVVSFLGIRFMEIHDTLPRAFCHGDYHALNVIWSPDGIRAVIDWEFAGYKPEIYDVANMVGCLGMEEPQSLVHDGVGDFIAHLKDAGIMTPVSWEYLLEFVIALRFAWLSEWLRHNDREMIALETTFLKLLQEHYDDLRDTWRL